ncbi:MAG TPA: DNRLRE domain-containing protein, partial [Candidatus Dormibacteraeota bacterium]|nr:DNRLRE domain-containing protein [Candidatus Dormibacteraeota bacterium]
RNTYLMFDVHALAGVRSAIVTLVPNRVDDTTVPMYYELAPTNWTEGGLTWNNQPGGAGVFLATNTVKPGVPVVLDVTSAATTLATNGGLLSLRITQPTNNLNGLIQFSSKEFATNSARPTLQYLSAPPFGATPAGLTASPILWNQINLSWSPTVGATYYNLRRSPNSGGPYTLVAQGLMTTNLNDTTVFSATTYYYVVSAVYSGGESTNSIEASALTPLLPAPAALTASLGNEVALTWTASSGATSYKVMRAFVSGGPYTTIATGVTGTNYGDSVYYTSATYYYVVSAVDAGGQSPNSPEASVTASNSLRIEPTDDTYVEDGSSTNTNFGTSADLKVKNQGPNTTFTRITYLKFNVQPLTNAQSVKLKLTPYQVDGSGVTNTFELVTNDAWTEMGMTWVNQPGGSGIIVTNIRGSSYSVGTQVTLDVTGWALGQATNDGLLSLRINDPNTNAILIGFGSKEYPIVSYHPVLEFVNPGNNTPPFLAAISNRTLGVGVMLTITNVATDIDAPPQTLTFSIPTAPTNAAINPTNGVFTWRPLVSQANTSNPFTVMVADNGTPAKSAAQSFVVTVTNLARPVLSIVPPVTAPFVLQVNGATGPDYQIQASTNLLDWNAVFTTNSPLIPFVWTNNITVPVNFFRALVGPPF